MRNFWLIFLIFMLFIPILGYFSGCQKWKEEEVKEVKKSPDPTLVALETLYESVQIEERHFSGDVMPWSIVPLMFKVAGKIDTFAIEEGQNIEAGDFVASMEPKDYALVRELARAQVNALSPHLTRVESLAKENAIPQAKFDELLGKMSLAKVQLEQASLQLSYTKLYSPVSGVVIQKKFDAGSLTSPEHPIAVVAEMRRVKVILPIPQKELGFFSQGQEITVETAENSTSELEKHRTYKGKVHAVGFVADPKTRTFPVTIEVDNSDLSLRAGMIVEVNLKVREIRGLFVPLESVTRDLGGNPSIFVVEDAMVAHARKLKLGSVYGDRVHVLEGLKAGERVVVRGRAYEGVPVYESQSISSLSVQNPSFAAPTQISDKSPLFNPEGEESKSDLAPSSAQDVQSE